MTAAIIGPDFLVVLAIIAVVLLAGTRISKVARSLGSARGEFEKGRAEGDDA